MVYKSFEKIANQQGAQKSTVFYVGEHLKEIIKSTPGADEIIAVDLDIEGMSIKKCEGKIREYANKNGGCTPPEEADRIIREFYGLPSSGQRKTISLADLL